MSLSDQLCYNFHDLLPAIVQHADTGAVLKLTWMSRAAVEATQTTGRLHGYNWSEKSIGELTEPILQVRDIRTNTAADELLVTAVPQSEGDAGFDQLWQPEAERFREAPPVSRQDILEDLYQIIQQRKAGGNAQKSYVASLFNKGLDKILGKIGEEATEAAVAGKGGHPEEVVAEVADLVFHVLVLLGYYDLPPARIYAELRRRFGLSGLEEKASRSE